MLDRAERHVLKSVAARYRLVPCHILVRIRTLHTRKKKFAKNT